MAEEADTIEVDVSDTPTPAEGRKESKTKPDGFDDGVKEGMRRAKDKVGAQEELTLETTDKPIVTPDEGTADLKRKLDEALRQQAESAKQAQNFAARAQQEQQKAQAAQAESGANQLALVSGALDQAKAQATVLEDAYEQAAAAGDHRKMAQISRSMAANEARVLTLENGKVQMEAQAKQPPPRSAPIIADPVEALAAQLPPASAAWIRAHPEYARDGQKYGQMISAHNLVIRKHAADTPEYFSAVEKLLEIEPTSQASSETSQRTPPAAAPVSRSGNGTGSRPNVVTLTADQKEAALLNFPELADKDPQSAYRAYAQNLLELKKRGAIH